MAAILGFFFAGITFLNYWYGIVPVAKVTVLSQVAKETFGGAGIMYYVVQFATALILAVAANTGFSAFPVLALTWPKISLCRICIWIVAIAWVTLTGF